MEPLEMTGLGSMEEVFRPFQEVSALTVVLFSILAMAVTGGALQRLTHQQPSLGTFSTDSTLLTGTLSTKIVAYQLGC